MPARYKAKAVKKSSFQNMLLFPIMFMPLAILYVANLPISDLDKGLLDGAVAGMQVLMVLALYRFKTSKK
ncbi:MULTISPECIES: hypothetical protein [Acetobacter]|uniref:Uncharacterized protein n=1 Tax=Acetobacter cerevisiae TaxID=178900 RepID=A0A149Q9G5_9PROT|nr:MULTISPECIES: hypothetical protein [Acetobacter]KXU93892.1 hypothetical protein AD928_07960 [Acetobacter cerevisiae]GBQ07095.1 hypothetical protein AA14362_1171 [Acetobacter cerevisiae DSM 14362]